MLLLVFYYCICAFPVAVAVSSHLCVVCSRHCCSLMLLFQGHVACWNFTLEGRPLSFKNTIIKCNGKSECVEWYSIVEIIFF